jgi:hypothetical protein
MPGSPSLSSRRPSAGNIEWNKVVLRSEAIVKSYDTGVTLRQLYYRLVSEGLIPNNQNTYKLLSRKTAKARREGWFPSLIDRTREIERFQTFEDPDDALNYIVEGYRRDRMEGQPWSIYLGVEKHGMSVQLMHWFGKWGIPVLALGGYSSQTFVDDVKIDVEKQNRKSVLLYAGDFDPSGMDIDRDFVERTEIFDKVIRVGLDAELIEKFDLPPMPGKETDSRSARFMLKHGDLIQVELDALPPNELRKLYQKAINKFFKKAIWQKAYDREQEERKAVADAHALVDWDEVNKIGIVLDWIVDRADDPATDLKGVATKVRAAQRKAKKR